MRTFPQKPYFDDFKKEKKFYQILFKPSMAVQARELTQLQSILQNQINNIGDHFFKDGSKVIDGEVGFDVDVHCVRLQKSVRNIDDIVDKTLTGNKTKAKAKVLTYRRLSQNDTTYLYVKFISSNQITNNGFWHSGESLSISEERSGADLIIDEGANAIKPASIASIQRGVYYVKGHFVMVDKQTIILEDSNVPSFRVGLAINEQVINSEIDQSLLDNAIGSYNYTASGADRYYIDLVLTKLPISQRTDTENFIELGQLQNGKIVKQVTKTEYSDLENTLARRTYDESGDYVVRPFKIAVREHRSNDRGPWREGARYDVGDIVRNNKNTYVAKTSGIAKASEAPTHNENQNDTVLHNSIVWECTSNPPFNNGVFPAEGKVTEIKIVNPGNGYIVNPDILIESNSGKGASATAIVSNGKLVDVIVDNPGSGYMVGDVTVKVIGGLGRESEHCVCDDQGNESAVVNAVCTAVLDSGDNQKVAVGLESGKAYVRGYEIEKVGTTWLAVNKARKFDSKRNVLLTPHIGNYIKVTNIIGCPPLHSQVTTTFVDLYDRILDPKTNKPVSGANKVGRCRIRGIEWDSGIAHSNDGIYKLYIYDVEVDRHLSFESVVKSVYVEGFGCNIEPERISLTGSVTINKTKGVGSGTTFRTQLQSGDYIVVDDNLIRVESVDGQNNITVDGDFVLENKAFSLFKTTIYQPQNSGLVFKLPHNMIKSMIDYNIDYTTSECISNGTVINNGSNVVVTFSTSHAFANVEETDNYILFDNTTGKIVKYKPTQTQSASRNISFEVDNSLAGHSFTLIATIRKSGMGVGRQQKTSTFAKLVITDANKLRQSEISLQKADVYKAKVLMYPGQSTNGAIDQSLPGIDITDRYVLDDGQTANYYGVSKLRLKSGISAPTYPIIVQFYYFRHGSGDYFDVDSYDVPYEDIPNYIDGSSLRDVIDFRPVLIEGENPSKMMMIKRGTEIEVGYDFYLGRKDKIVLDYLGNFLDVEGVSSEYPANPETPSLSMNVYDLDFAPYTLTVDSSNINVTQIDNKRYTMRDIGALDNRITVLEKYTTLSMLEQQTESLEIKDENGLNRFKVGFAVDSFNNGSQLLTLSTDRDYCSIDSLSQCVRPSFTTHHVSLSEYIPAGTSTNANTRSSNYQMYGKVYTLPLDPVNPHVKIVEQNLASRIQNVNPFAVASFIGSLDVNPSSDDWYETEYRPDIINHVEGNYLSSKKLEGTKWNSWQTSWTGAKSTISSSGWKSNGSWWRGQRGWDRSITESWKVGQTRTGVKTTVFETTDVEQVGDRLVQTGVIPYMRSRWLLIKAKRLRPFTRYYPYFDHVNVDYWCVPVSRVEVKTITGKFSGDAVYASDTSTARRIDQTRNSYWRENTDKTCLDIGDVIIGKSSHLTGVVVNVTKEASINDPNKIVEVLYVANIKRKDGNTVDGNDVGENNGSSFMMGETIHAPSNSTQPSATVLYAQGNRNHNDPLITNQYGDLVYLFYIPNPKLLDYGKISNDVPVFQFRCGERVISLSADKDSDDQSGGTTTYSATGILNTRQKTFNAVRNARIVTENLSESRTTTQTATRKVHRWYDPLAQTFIVDRQCFISKVDLYFASKPGRDQSQLPVTVQIRTCENGIPTNTILPFAEKTLNADEIKISENRIQYIDDRGDVVKTNKYDVATTFEFDSPVYVDQSCEYAIVVLSDSNDYNVWISKVGDIVPATNNVISKQPYMGTLLKSQNASTWTPSQSEDLKMTIWRANFFVSDKGGGKIIGDVAFACNDTKKHRLSKNCFQTKKDSGLVRIVDPKHGMVVGMKTVLNIDKIGDIDQSNTLKGSITTVSYNKTVIGNNTEFTKQLSVGDVIYAEDGTMVGKVNQIVNDGELIVDEIPSVNIEEGVYRLAELDDDINGIPFNKLIGVHEIKYADIDSYVIDLSEITNIKATSSGYGGDGNWFCNHTYNYDVINPNVTIQNFSNTNVKFEMSGVNGTILGQSMNQIESGSFGITVNENNYLNYPFAVYDKHNRLTNRRPSLIVHCKMTSNDPCLSPVIDSDRVSAILINNLINDPDHHQVNVNGLDDVEIVNNDKTMFVGEIDKITMTNIGGNYNTATVKISAPDKLTVENGGVQAKAIPIINNGRVVDIVITEKGVGYYNKPTVTIVGSEISGKSITEAKAEATVNVNMIATTDKSTINDFRTFNVGCVTDVTTDNKSVRATCTNVMINDVVGVVSFDNHFDQLKNDKKTKVVQMTKFVSEIAPIGGSAIAKYVTKPITLSGSCNKLKVMFAVHNPQQRSKIDLYYKAYQNQGSKQYDDVNWVKVNDTDITVSSSNNGDEFVDVEYDIDDIASFDTVAIKLVFKGTNTSIIPEVKDFRTIACI